jgi:hypothetical protein
MQLTGQDLDQRGIQLSLLVTTSLLVAGFASFVVICQE